MKTQISIYFDDVKIGEISKTIFQVGIKKQNPFLS